MKNFRFNIKHFYSYLIAFLTVFIYSYIIYKKMLISLVIAGFISIKFEKVFYNLQKRRQDKTEKLLFKEFLDIFNSYISSGLNFYDSIVNCKFQINNTYSKKMNLLKDINDLVSNLDNGYTENDALKVLEKTTKLMQLKLFAQVLQVALVTGMNLSQIVIETKRQLDDQIEMELEIGSIIDGGKREFIIMMILPAILIATLDFSNTSNIQFIDYIVRSVVYLVIILSFYLGQKIVSLEDR